MGFVLLGLMTLNQIGIDGAVLQMFSHGIIAGLLFAIVGRIVYERTHTRDLGIGRRRNRHRCRLHLASHAARILQRHPRDRSWRSKYSSPRI
jgi:NADH:ubiquinone oxidoreductase subunit 5 (subunit L)/multisubunit Na+/H+ antiporter MnhA subunit